MQNGILQKFQITIIQYQHFIIIDMFGGNLLTSTISINKNCFFSVYTNQLYVFDLEQTQLLKKITLLQNLVKAWTFLQGQNKLIALDQEGNLTEIEFKQEKKIDKLWYQNYTTKNTKIPKSHIHDARIVLLGDEKQQYSIYFIQQNALYEYINGQKNVISKNSGSILFSSQSHIIIKSSTKQNTIKILSLNQNSSQKQVVYEHSNSITSALIGDSTLIIGDVKGKIYVLRNYLEVGKVSQQLTTKYQWHVHQVNSLFLQGEYLYSAGQEGTVVMWHLREGKIDFLPRVGTQITNIIVNEGIVYCILKDNQITAIDLNNDKLIRHYKTILNPFGFMTKSVKQNGFNGKKIIFATSQSNSRNLILASNLPGSLQLLNANDGSNHEIQILPRNLISRLDDYYPQPHDIYDVSLNKDWTLMCCSTYGINHNYLHFYKNQGYNLDYTLISKVQNPHEGPIQILNFNNTFITFSQNEKTLRFWSKIRKSKKSIIQKEEEYFTCSGQINYRQKSIKNCSVLTQQNLLLINYEDQIVLVDLKKREIQIAFKGKCHYQQALLVKKSKTLISLVLVTKNKIIAYDLNKTEKNLKNMKLIYVFQNDERLSVQNTQSLNGHIAFLIKYASKQVVLEYDLNKSSILQSFQNESPEQVSLLSISYIRNKLITFSSDCSLTNLTNNDQIVKLSSKSSTHSVSSTIMDTEDDSIHHQYESESYEALNRNYLQRMNVRKRAQVNQTIQKIELQMYPNLGFAFTALCDKMFL